MHPELLLIQDGALGHSAAFTREELRERGIELIFWPPFSPDLNPIEMAWNWMKDWIQGRYPDDINKNYDRLRDAVIAAWRAIPEAFLDDLIEEMGARYQAVIDANGMHTKY